MAKRTLSGSLGVLILPDSHVVNETIKLTESEGVSDAEYRVRPEDVHVTLFRERYFENLPIDIATKLVAKLNESLVSHPAGELLMYFLDVKPAPDNERFLFWNVDRTKKNQRLMTAHGMSLALSVWVKPAIESEHRLENRISGMSVKLKARERKLRANVGVFGTSFVGEDYLPHITIAMNPNGFKGFVPLKESLIGSASRVVLARMAMRGKIDEILI